MSQKSGTASTRKQVADRKSADRKAAAKNRRRPSRTDTANHAIFTGTPVDAPRIALQIDRARNTGRWLIAIFRVDGSVAHLDWASQNYPQSEIDLSIRLLIDQLNKLKAGQ